MAQLGVPPEAHLQHLTGSELAVEVLAPAPDVGPDPTEWPGPAAYRRVDEATSRPAGYGPS